METSATNARRPSRTSTRKRSRDRGAARHQPPRRGGPWRNCRTIYEKFIPKEERTGKLYKFDTPALAPEAFLTYSKTHTGEAGHGKKIFMDQNGVGCVKCHRSPTRAAMSALPSTASVANIRGISSSNRFSTPASRSLTGYQQTVIKRKSNGNVEYGIVRGRHGGKRHAGRQRRAEDHHQGRRHRQPQDQQCVRSCRRGCRRGLKPEDFVDVVAYLETLKEARKSDIPTTLLLAAVPKARVASVK